MPHQQNQIPGAKAILQAWMPFKQLIGVTSVHTEADYHQAITTINSLLEEIGDDESHPLAEVLDYLSDQVQTYENRHFPVPKAEPREVLKYLMDEHGLKQEDLADCAPQSRISEILAGKRAVSKGIAKRLAARFSVNVELFIA